MTTIELGDKVKDTITGFTGIVMARTEWTNGCVTYAIAPTELSKDGTVHEKQWFDAEQLEVVEKLAYQVPDVTDPPAAATPGGPNRGEPQSPR